MGILSYSTAVIAFGRGINRGNYATTTALALVVCIVMISTLVLVVLSIRRKKQHKTIDMLRRELGLEFFKAGKRNETGWYAGKYGEFNLAMQGRTVSYRGSVNVNRPSSARIEVSYVVRLCLALPGIDLDDMVGLAKTIQSAMGGRSVARANEP